jgi:phosphatidylinositol-3-phosphatase
MAPYAARMPRRSSLRLSIAASLAALALAGVAAAAAPKPVNTALPTISGTARDGQTLTAAPGTWSAKGTVTYAYQWLRCSSSTCANITGAAAQTYRVVSADVGSTLQVRVTARSSTGPSATATSARTATVAALAPANSTLPSISGTVQVGGRLAALPGTWTGTTPLSYAYSWQRCSDGSTCSAIPGATASGYTLTSSDVGSSVAVVVTAGNAAGAASAASLQSARVMLITKVLTFVEENHSYAEMQAQMPYLASLAGRYGYANQYFAITHPSLPNYLAIAGGDTFGVTDDAYPEFHPISGPSVFGQAIAAGLTAKTYAESMDVNCSLGDDGGSGYAVRHNPWTYFADERALCNSNDVPAGTPAGGALATDIAAGQLPNAGMVIPNGCNDAHDCGLATADAWLQGWLPQILGSPDFTTGRLAVVITADEDDYTSANKVLTVVLHNSLQGKVVAGALDHYSLTGFYAEVTRTAPLLKGVSASSMAAAFGLPLG